MLWADWEVEIYVFQFQRRNPLPLPDGLYHNPCVDHLKWQNFEILVQRPKVENGPITAIDFGLNKLPQTGTSEMALEIL